MSFGVFNSSNDVKARVIAKAVSAGEITQDQAIAAAHNGTVDALIATLKTADAGDAIADVLATKFNGTNVYADRDARAFQLGGLGEAASKLSQDVDPDLALSLRADSEFTARKAAR